MGGWHVKFDVAQPVTVWVAHDLRVIQKPDWLLGFQDTGRFFRRDKVGHFRLYTRDFASGTVTLGGNLRPKSKKSSVSMYQIYVVPRRTANDSTWGG